MKQNFSALFELKAHVLSGTEVNPLKGHPTRFLGTDYFLLFTFDFKLSTLIKKPPPAMGAARRGCLPETERSEGAGRQRNPRTARCRPLIIF